MRTEELLHGERLDLIRKIARRTSTARQLANEYGTTIDDLRQFVAENEAAIKAHRDHIETAESNPADLTPENLADLWITNKFERLKRLQVVADETYKSITNGSYMSPAEQSTVVREFRSYLMLAANELGQLLHRGSGESGTEDTLSVRIDGVDMENLR